MRFLRAQPLLKCSCSTIVIKLCKSTVIAVCDGYIFVANQIRQKILKASQTFTYASALKMSGNFVGVSVFSIEVCSVNVKFLAKLIGETVLYAAFLTLRRHQLKVHKK